MISAYLKFKRFFFFFFLSLSFRNWEFVLRTSAKGCATQNEVKPRGKSGCMKSREWELFEYGIDVSSRSRKAMLSIF